MGEVQCQLCGERDVLLPVHACAVHDQCVPRRYKAGTRDALASCRFCPERMLPPASEQ